jgi:hypothetical protein
VLLTEKRVMVANTGKTESELNPSLFDFVFLILVEGVVIELQILLSRKAFRERISSARFK